MYKTLHHIKLIGETFWREVVDRQARRGAYEVNDNNYNKSIIEMTPAHESYVQLDFLAPPSSYNGEPEDYTTKTYIVQGNLAALIGIEDDNAYLFFEDGQTEMTLSMQGRSIPVGGNKMQYEVNRKGNKGSKMNYKFSFGSTKPGTSYPDANSIMLTEPTTAYDTIETLTYNYTERYRTLESITISRTAQTGDTPYPEMYIQAPIIHLAVDDSFITWPLTGHGHVTEINWNGADRQKRVKVENNRPTFLVMEPKENGFAPYCDVYYVGNVRITVREVWKQLKEIISGKVDKVTGKGLSTNDYTTAEKTKLAGVEANANAYTLPNASSSTVGGVKVHADTVVGQNASPLQTAVNSGRLYALAPYADVDMAGLFMPGEGFEQAYVGLDGQEAQKVDGQFDVAKMGGATASAAGKAGMVPQPAAGDQMKYLRGDGTWDDLRSVIYNCYPVAWAPMDNGTHGWWPYDENGWTIPTDAANNVPPQVMNVALLAGPDTSYESLTLSFSYLNMIFYEPITIDFVELLGHPFNGGNTVQIDSNGIVIAGVRYAKSYNIPMMGGMTVKADQTCSFQIAYRQNPVAVIQSLDNRITALENA